MMMSQRFGHMFCLVSLLAVGTACASAPPETPVETPEAVGTAQAKMIDESFIEVAEAADQGGCSMSQIRRCGTACGGPVSACYSSGIGWVSCYCNSGDGWWIWQ